MNIEVTVNIPALDRLVEVLKASVSLPTVAASTEGKAELKTRTKASEAKSEATQPSTQAAATSEASTAGTSTSTVNAAKAETAEDLLGKVKETAMVLSQKKGRDKLMDLLGEFGATNISGVPVDQHSAFIAEATSRAAA